MNVGLREALSRAGIGFVIVGALVLTLAVSLLVPEQPALALAVAGAFLVTVLALVNPVTLPLLAMPLIVVVHRVAGGGIDLPVADVAVGLAFWPAVLLAPRPFSPELRRLLWLNAIYQATTFFTVIANPFLANTIDWFHNWLLITCALIVGWAVGRSGAARLGMWLFLAAVGALAVFGIAEAGLNYAQGNFQPLYPNWPFPMHKNFFGSVMAFAALVLYARPSLLRMPRWMTYTLFWLLAVAIGVSQARQAVVALAVGLFIIAFRGRGERRRGWLGAFLGVPALVVVATLVRDQVAEGDEHNSFFQRVEWYGQSVANWRESPLLGLGLRYWTEQRGLYNFHPPQVFLEVLATTGIIGLAGFVIMMAGMVITLWRLPGPTATLALALLVARLVQGQFDIFWLSPTTSMPFLLIGVLLGVLEYERSGSSRVSARSELVAAQGDP